MPKNDQKAEKPVKPVFCAMCHARLRSGNKGPHCDPCRTKLNKERFGIAPLRT